MNRRASRLFKRELNPCGMPAFIRPGDSTMRSRRLTLPFADSEVDLVPLIDCVFLLLLFFMLCGHISVNNRAEQITVPPAKTAHEIYPPQDWQHEIINLGGGRANEAVRIRLGQTFDSAGLPPYEGLTRLRALLDQLHAISPTYRDPANGLLLPQVLIELRIDVDVPWLAVQEIQQVLADSIVPATGLPKDINEQRRPFTSIAFSVHDPMDH
jgi:Biopolymer transport protein ExbD/TolR